MRRILAGLVLCAGLLFAAPQGVQAAAAQPQTIMAACSTTGVAAFLNFKSWDNCLSHDANGVPQITKISDIWLVVLPLLEDAIKVAAYAAAGFVIWGGIKYIKSQGDPGQFNEARQVIYNALFGLLLAMISVAIVNFVAGAF